MQGLSFGMEKGEFLRSKEWNIFHFSRPCFTFSAPNNFHTYDVFVFQSHEYCLVFLNSR